MSNYYKHFILFFITQILISSFSYGNSPPSVQITTDVIYGNQYFNIYASVYDVDGDANANGVFMTLQAPSGTYRVLDGRMLCTVSGNFLNCYYIIYANINWGSFAYGRVVAQDSQSNTGEAQKTLTIIYPSPTPTTSPTVTFCPYTLCNFIGYCNGFYSPGDCKDAEGEIRGKSRNEKSEEQS